MEKRKRAKEMLAILCIGILLAFCVYVKYSVNKKYTDNLNNNSNTEIKETKDASYHRGYVKIKTELSN